MHTISIYNTLILSFRNSNPNILKKHQNKNTQNLYKSLQNEANKVFISAKSKKRQKKKKKLKL